MYKGRLGTLKEKRGGIDKYYSASFVKINALKVTSKTHDSHTLFK